MLKWQENKALQTLTLYSNPIQDEGAAAIFEALQVHTTPAILRWCVCCRSTRH